MTMQQMLVMAVVYLAALVVVAYFTRPCVRRLAGALAAGAAVGLALLGVIPLAETLGLWRVSLSWTPAFLSLFYLAVIVSSASIFLISWRVARRFGGCGLVVLVASAAVIGPPRDYAWATMFPEWVVFAPGMAPVFGVAATYMCVGALGHAVMRLVAGPSAADPLARRRWETGAEVAASRT